MGLLHSNPTKKFIQFLALIFFPITINYMSPYIIITAAFQGVINGSLILFAALMIGSVFFGRLFCSTLCPAGTASDYLGQIVIRPSKNGRVNLTKWIIWVPWMAGIIGGFINSGGIKAIKPLFMTESGISVDQPVKYITYLGVMTLIVGLNMIVGKRAFCHYACWMAPFMILGIKIRNLLHLPGLTLRSKTSNCIKCGKCSTQCPMSLDVKQMVLEERMTESECILCGKCIEVCPKDVIDYRFAKN